MANYTIDKLKSPGGDIYNLKDSAAQRAILTTTITLATNGWSNKSQTVNVTGITANDTIVVSPVPVSVDDYGEAGIYCSAQGAGTLTFVCNTVPTGAVSVNVMVLTATSLSIWNGGSY